MAEIETRLKELYDELADILRYSSDGAYEDPTADAAVVRTLIHDILQKLQPP